MEEYSKAFNKICRVCLKPDNINVTPLIEGNFVNNYGKSLMQLSFVKVTPNDNLPSNICLICLSKLQQFINFKIQCEETNQQLLNISINKQKDNIKQMIVELSLYNYYFHNDTEHDDKSVNKVEETIDSDLDSHSDNDISYSDTNLDIDKHDLKNDDDDILDVLDKLVEYNCFKGDSTFKRHKIIRIKRISDERHKFRARQKRVIIKNDTSTSYVCEICNKRLANHITYKNHLQKHNGYRFICEHCGKGYATKAELHFHLVACHGTGKYLQCEHCNFKAPRRCDLVEHIRIHTGERPFTCDKCGLTFRRRGIWSKHRYYHGEKSFQCTLCPRRFYLRSGLASHTNNVHNRLYMYICHVCGATYAKTETVRRHLSERHGITRDKQGKIIRIQKDTQTQDLLDCTRTFGHSI